MVEGPGCTRNGQKVRAAVLRRKVVGVAGINSAQVAGYIRSRVLIDVITLGKQLWLFFSAADQGEEVAVRCHFGMAGSLVCNQSAPSGHKKQLTLLVRFEPEAELRVYDSTATLANARAARELASSNHSRDVCNASSFDDNAALAALSAAPASRMISDVLLDQSVLPGVGNIIKVAAPRRSLSSPESLLPLLSLSSASPRPLPCLASLSLPRCTPPLSHLLSSNRLLLSVDPPRVASCSALLSPRLPHLTSPPLFPPAERGAAPRCHRPSPPHAHAHS